MKNSYITADSEDLGIFSHFSAKAQETISRLRLVPEINQKGTISTRSSDLVIFFLPSTK